MSSQSKGSCVNRLELYISPQGLQSDIPAQPLLQLPLSLQGADQPVGEQKTQTRFKEPNPAVCVGPVDVLHRSKRFLRRKMIKLVS